MLIVTLAGMLTLSIYGTLFPAHVRCGLPGAIGCPGGVLGPAALSSSGGEQWFNVTLFDYGFWIVDSTTGANESTSWNVYEGWTVHINATSFPPNPAVGGTAYHGLGVEINATGQQLLSLAAPVGRWVTATFVAPSTAYYHQHLWCTIECGPGHGGQQTWVLNIVPSTIFPSASVVASPSSGVAPLNVSFTATPRSGSPPYNLSWNFGDGGSDYRANVTHRYSLGGTYYPILTVMDAKGNRGSAGLTILVRSTAPLSATVAPTPGVGIAPLGVVFSAQSRGATPPYNYSWSFGDGSIASGGNVSSHLYSSPGIYAVVATVTDSAGSVARTLTTVRVQPSTGSFPLTIVSNPSNGSAPLQVKFQAVPAGGIGPYSDFWVFGDGSTSAGSSVTHFYNLSGSYVATVFSTDSTGKVATSSRIVPVQMFIGGGGNLARYSPAPLSGGLKIFLLTVPPTGGAPLAVLEAASIERGTGKLDNVSWNFGDGTIGSGQIVMHPFNASGTFKVTAAASDSARYTGSASTTVQVGGMHATIVLNRTAADAPVSVASAASVQGGSGNYPTATWTWGDGSSSQGFLSNHSYANGTTGPMTIVVTVTDSTGTTATARASLTIFPAVHATLGVTLPGSRTPPFPVVLALQLSGGSGVYSQNAQWTFGDRSGSQAPNMVTHNYTSPGHFLVLVQTTDSLGGAALATAWVNISGSGGAPPGGHAPVWSFTGVPDPNRAALVLLGLIAVTGLALLWRKRRRKASQLATRSVRSRASAPSISRAKSGAVGPLKES